MTTKKKKNKEVYSFEDENLSIVKSDNKESGLVDDKQKTGLSLNKDGLNMGAGANLLIGNLNINSNLRRRHEKHYKNSKFHLIADLAMASIIIILLIVVLWLSFWQPHAQITLNSGTKEEIVKSGELQTFYLDYRTNRSSDNNTIAVKLPNNFEFVSAVPSDKYSKDTHTFNLGKLSSGSNGEVKISGYVYSEVGNQEAVSFTYNCSICGKTGVLSSHLFNVEDSVLDLKISSPKNIYKDIENLFRINIENTSSKDIEDLYIEISDAWLVSSNNYIENNTIIIDEIKALEDSDIEFKLISPISVGTYDLEIKVYLNKNGKKLLQETWKKQVSVLAPELKTELNYINNNDNNIAFNLDFNNNGNKDLSDLSFRLIAGDNIILDNLSLNQSVSNVEIIDNIIKFNSSLEPQESHHLGLKVKAEQIEPKLNPETKIILEASYLSEASRFSYQVSSNPIKLLSNLDASAKAYYYSTQGDQLGIGPLPPQVNLPTTYWIFLDASNFGNSLSNFSLSGELAKNVIWANKKSIISGSIYQAPGSNKFTWQIRNIDNNSLDNQARFAISLMPDESQLGTIPLLLENITVSAYDNFTQKNISFNLEDINTQLYFDSLASGEGRVEN
jgi:hypothetical protein